jgi:hypothetical protein
MKIVLTCQLHPRTLTAIAHRYGRPKCSAQLARNWLEGELTALLAVVSAEYDEAHVDAEPPVTSGRRIDRGETDRAIGGVVVPRPTTRPSGRDPIV